MNQRTAFMFFVFALVAFRWDVKPILEDHCLECHSAEATLDLSSFPFASDYDTDQRTIVDKILSKVGGTPAAMPPGNRPKLTAVQVQTIRKWREDGLEP